MDEMERRMQQARRY